MAGFYNCLKSQNDYIMATGPADVIQPPEAGETTEECAGKKKSKFQTFKSFFAKKKRKEPPTPKEESNLKPSQSSSDVSIPALDTVVLHSPTQPGSKGSMGNKALSHDSVFIFESAPENTAGDVSSQENIPGKVKTLQLQLQENIRLGSPPLVIFGRKLEDAGAVSEDDGLPRSPPEISTLHEVLTCSPSKSSNPVQRHSSLSLGGTDSEDEQIPSDEVSSRPVSPLSSLVLVIPATQASSLLPVDFNTPASPLGCLDTSAARHRIAINPRKQRVFPNKNHQIPVEQLEKEQCLPVTSERKSTTKFLDADQDEIWAGSSVWEENNGKGSGPTETQAIAKTDSSTSCPWNSVSDTDIVCTLLEEDACPIETAHHYKVTASFPNVPSSLAKSEEENKAEDILVPYCSNESIDEFKLLQQNTDEVIELAESPQTEPEAIVFQDILASDFCGTSMEKEDIHILADDTQVSLKQPVDQSDKEPRDSGVTLVGKVDDHPCINENNFNWPDSDPALCDSQVHLASLETFSEVERVAGLVPENTPAAKDDKEMCKVLEFQPSEDHVNSKTFLQKTSVVSMSNIDCVLPQSKVNKEQHFKPEMHCPVSEVSQSNQETDASNNLEKLSIECLASLSLAGFKSFIPPSADDKENQQLGGVTSQEKTRKESKTLDENVKTPLKSAATKPVRFTIAPAWQRSLSGGSNTKEDSCTRSSPSSPIRPELFEGTALLDTTMQDSTKNNSEGFERGNKSNEANLSSSMEGAEHETQNAENPFGIRLRRTSSLLKYHTESSKQIPLAIHTTSNGSVREDQKSVAIGKPSQGLPGSIKASAKKSAVMEEKNAPKTKPEEVSKKQHLKLPEKVPSLHLETVSSEPAWVSMAKLKQKGFQDHPLAKGHKRKDKTLTTTDQEERVTCASEQLLRKNVAPSLCTQEKKSQMKITMSAAAAVTLGSMAQEAAVVPTTEKETKQSSSLPVTPCSSVEPPWLSLAKKKAKAWSEMPQIVQ